MADSNFYRAFEERHRGSQDLIKSRLTVYLPFILPLRQFDDALLGIDLGCGRGEWLELMQENELDVQGVDLDQGMLDAARERNLNVRQDDAIQALQSLTPESQMLVSGFHIAEHLPFEVLKTLIDESLRVLKAGGLLILETPNPENIVVGTTSFYLDPTHKQPIPFQLLSFMAEYSGFEKVKVLRLQELIGLADNDALTLLSVLNGVSPDYAVVAQKGGAPEIAAATAQVFEADYGLSLESLANSYDQQVKAKAQQAELIAQQAQDKAQQAESMALQAEAKALQAQDKAQQAETKAQQAEIALCAINNSTSWRLTAPLRMIGRAVKKALRLANAAKPESKDKAKLLLAHAKLYINQRPKLRRLAFTILARYPALESYIRRTTRFSGQITHPPVATELANLTPRAHNIYVNLKAAIENRIMGDF